MKKCFLVFVLLICLFTISVNAQTFSDVSEENWYYEDIMSAINKGYINGLEDGTFRPNDKVTYGEFYKMLVEAKDEKIEEKENSTHWAYKYASFLRFNGDSSIITYNLDGNIERQEVIRNVLYLFGITDTVEYCFYTNKAFEDMPKSTIYCYDGYIQNAYQLGIVFGNNNYINPKEFITRAEAVSIIERALKVDDWSVPAPDVLRGLKVEYVGEESKSYLNDICSGVSKMPEYIIDSFIEDDGKFIVTDEAIEYNYAGLYSMSEKYIKIFTGGKSSNIFFSSVGTVIHEIGHYMHFEILSESDKVELENIFNNGVEVQELYKQSGDRYCKTDVYEYWAELVSFYYSYDSDKNLSKLPKSYEILKKYLE